MMTHRRLSAEATVFSITPQIMDIVKRKFGVWNHTEKLKLLFYTHIPFTKLCFQAIRILF